MRATRIILTLSVLAILFVCVGVVAALDQDQASVNVFPTSETVAPGQAVGITLIFNNNSPDSLTLTSLGVHFDWMDSGGFFGFNLSSTPITVQAGGNYPFTQPINIQVPTTASLGNHSYYIGVDGTQGSSNTPFSWDSPASTILVSNGGGTGPTTTINPTSSSSQGGGQDMLLYGVAAVVVIIVVLMVVIVVMRMRKKPANLSPAATPAESPMPTTPPTSSPSPETNPESEQTPDKE